MNSSEDSYTVGSDIKYVHDGALNNQYVTELYFENSSTQVGNYNSNGILETVYTTSAGGSVWDYYRGNSKNVELYGGTTPTPSPSEKPSPIPSQAPVESPKPSEKPTVKPSPSTPPTSSTPSGGGSSSGDTGSSGGGTYYPSASYSYKPWKGGHIKR